MRRKVFRSRFGGVLLGSLLALLVGTLALWLLSDWELFQAPSEDVGEDTFGQDAQASEKSMIAENGATRLRSREEVLPPLLSAENAVFGDDQSRTITVGDVTVIYERGQLFNISGSDVLVAPGQTSGAAHSDPGYFGIWYLKKSLHKWEVVQAYPLFVKTGTFGAPPEWSQASGIGYPGMTLQIEGFGQWFGDATGWTSVVTLGHRKPELLLNNIITARDIPVRDDRLSEKNRSLIGQIHFSREKNRFIVRYSGDEEAEVSYVLQAGRYKMMRAQRLPEMLVK